MVKFILILLFSISVSAQIKEAKRIDLSPVTSNNSMNRIIECYELEIQYHIQKELLKVSRNIERDLRYSLEFQQKESERLKRVNEWKDETIELYILDTNALKKENERLRNQNKFFSLPTLRDVGIGAVLCLLGRAVILR